MNAQTVRLVAISKPVIPELANVEDLVAYTARVSNPGNQMNTETSSRLLKYLIRNSHWSPFEMAHVVMEINTTRDIARQILRHRSFSFQEFSQRYAEATELGFSSREARLQDSKNRQASIEVGKHTQLANEWDELQKELLEKVSNVYSWALSNGIAKEQARAVLPEGMTGSRLYMAGTLRSWIHYCTIRTDIATQKEHREIALMALNVLETQFPSISELLNDSK
jgi:thymidylate synthase (FAD)